MSGSPWSPTRRLVEIGLNGREMSDEDDKLIRQIVAGGGRKYTGGNIDRRKYERLIDLGWLTSSVTNISDVEYDVTEKGRAAAVEDRKSRLFAAERERVSVGGTQAHVDFGAPAVLRKWPSLRNERRTENAGAYLVVDGNLDECIREFMGKPISTRHLYEIHTSPQRPLVTAVLSSEEHIVELARLRDFL